MSQSARSSKLSIKIHAIFCHASISGGHILQTSRKAGKKSNYKRIKETTGYFLAGADQRRQTEIVLLINLNYYHSKVKE